ncbi:MAG TPA: hypothetical protein VLH79_15480 [Chthonomonadales bacterium]|nr:hypothetical protein [Chthonomonadales bacterium]
MRHATLALAIALTAAGWTARAAEAPAHAAEEPARGGGLRLSQWTVNGRIDWHLMRTDASGPHAMEKTRGKLMGAEIETFATLSDGVRDVLNIGLQWPYATDMAGADGRGRQMHFGNAFLVAKLGLGRPNIRVGQFVVPFGNLPVYETHTRPLQTLYAHSLGVRIDRGVSIEGMAGAYDYWLAVMGGNGARGDNDGRPMFVARAARRFELPGGGRLTAGVSGLRGDSMPRFVTGVDPTMAHGGMHMPLHHILDFTDKARWALDGEFELMQDTWRAELVAGRDTDGEVDGQFLQWNRALAGGAELTAQVARWSQPGGVRLAMGASLGREIEPNTTVRVAVTTARGRMHGATRRETTLVLQIARDFPRLIR